MSVGNNHEGGLGLSTYPNVSTPGAALPGIGTLSMQNFRPADISMFQNHMHALAQVHQMQQNAFHLQSQFASPLHYGVSPTSTVTRGDTNTVENKLENSLNTSSPSSSSLSVSPSAVSPNMAAKQSPSDLDCSASSVDIKVTSALTSPTQHPAVMNSHSSPVFPVLAQDSSFDDISDMTSSSPAGVPTQTLVNQLAAFAAQQKSLPFVSPPDHVSLAVIGEYLTSQVSISCPLVKTKKAVRSAFRPSTISICCSFNNPLLLA